MIRMGETSSEERRYEAAAANEIMTRYARQAKLLGEEGQRRLKNATVLIAGIGGLGGTAALYLAAAGVGRLILAHEGIIKLPDLNRQILMESDRLGQERISCAIGSLHRLNPDVEVEGFPERITVDRALPWVERADLVVDARYDFPERYALNEACRLAGKPMVEAAMLGFEISLTVIQAGRTPCLECLYPVRDAEWEPLGFSVLGATSGMAGCLAASEAIKWLSGTGQPLLNRMMRMDTLRMEMTTFSLDQVERCPACGGMEKRMKREVIR